MEKRTAIGKSKKKPYFSYFPCSFLYISLSGPESADVSWVPTLCFFHRGTQNSPFKINVFKRAAEICPGTRILKSTVLRGQRRGQSMQARFMTQRESWVCLLWNIRNLWRLPSLYVPHSSTVSTPFHIPLSFNSLVCFSAGPSSC